MEGDRETVSTIIFYIGFVTCPKKMIQDSNQEAFFEFVRAGLFPSLCARILVHGISVDWSDVYNLAEEQSVIGLVAAGIDTLPPSERPPQQVVLQFVGSTLQLEKRNKAMNDFIASLIGDLRNADCYAVLVKGQGVAQCYEHPLWRASGDVDLLLSKENYEKAKEILTPRAESIDEEDNGRLHLGMTIDGWIVELHGTLITGISNRLNRVIDEVQSSIFFSGEVRSWLNKGTQVFLPSPNNDVFLVFSHILEHFYVEGIGLRQICDWCRLLLTYREEIDVQLLERRLRDAKILTEWKGFAALAVDFLGMPAEAMLLYDDATKWRKKADKIRDLILKSGNFGRNKDKSYRANSSKVKSLTITFWRRVKEFAELTTIFPSQTPRIFLTYVKSRIMANV